MHSRRFACFVLGLWLGGGLLMAWIAAASFRSADRILTEPHSSAAPLIKTLGPGNTRALLRFHAADQNRRFFETWETAQLLLGLAFFSFLLFFTTERKTPLILVLIMIAIVAIQRFLLTPDMSASRDLELVPLGNVSVSLTKFWAIHSAYTSMEILKWGVGLALTVKLMLSRRRNRSMDPGEEFDVIDKTNYRHVDR